MKFIKKLLMRLIIGNEYEQYQCQKFAEQAKPFCDRVKKHNGRIVVKRRSIRVEFKCKEDEAAYNAERHRAIMSKVPKDFKI